MSMGCLFVFCFGCGFPFLVLVILFFLSRMDLLCITRLDLGPVVVMVRQCRVLHAWV